MDKFDNGVLSSVAVGWGLAHHLWKRIHADSGRRTRSGGKMNSIVKKRKDYRMDIIRHNPHGCGNLGGLVREERRVERRGGQTLLACGSKVIVWFS